MPLFALFTDFTHQGPYLGQLKAALVSGAPAVPVIDLMHDAPPCDPELSAYLLEPVCRSLPAGCCVLAVVDPGVGSARDALLLEADGRWFIGPDNGLLEFVARRACTWRCFRLPPPSGEVSPSFHGRDVFAPVAARLLADGPDSPGCVSIDFPWRDLAEDTPRIIYVDGYGNAWTGIRARMLSDQALLEVNGQTLTRAGTFSDVGRGQAFWYGNSSGLVELAVNRGRASSALEISPGDRVRLVRP